MFLKSEPQQDLSRNKIKQALQKVIDNKNDREYTLRHEVVMLIEMRFDALLKRNVTDSKEYLEKLLKAIINTIYLENRSQQNYSAKIDCDKENEAFNKALDKYNNLPKKNDALFEECILSTVPEDGRVFLINDSHLKPLQDLAKQCGVTLTRAWKAEAVENKPAASGLRR